MGSKQRHIKLESVDKICLVSGNPDRTEVIANHLKNPQQLSDYRGLVSYKGVTPENGVPVTILTTGMGGPSSAIVLEEAYYAGARDIIRVGSCGALQTGVPIGQIFIPFGAIRDEGTSDRIIPLEYPAIANPETYQILNRTARTMGFQVQNGLVWTSDIYYQKDPEYYKKWAKFGATCVEMESAVHFSLQGVKKNLKTATILTADGNLEDGINKYSGDMEKNYQIFDEAVEDMISIVVRAIDHNKDYFAG